MITSAWRRKKTGTAKSGLRVQHVTEKLLIISRNLHFFEHSVKMFIEGREQEDFKSHSSDNTQRTSSHLFT